MLLALVEEAADETQRVLLGRCHAQLVADLAVLVPAVDPLRRIDLVADALLE